MMDLTCWGVHFTLCEWFRSCALLAFIQPEISIKIQEEDWGSLWLQNVRLSLAPNLIMLMDVQHINPPVSLASSCYQGILKIYLDMISYSSFHLCLRTSSRAALGNRIQGLSCGEAIVSLSWNGFASAHYRFFWCLRFRERNRKALLEVLETRCMRMYVCTCSSPFKVTILRYLQASSSLVSHRYLLQNCCTQSMEHSCPWMKRHFPRIEDPIHDSVHILADPVAHRHDRNCPRSTWGGISWMGAVIRWYGSCWDMTTCDDRISQYLVDWIMCCLVIDIPILIILDPKPSFDTLDLWSLHLRSSTIGYAKKANRS